MDYTEEQLKEINRIVNTEFASMNKADKEVLVKCTDPVIFHDTYGRYLRNAYSLWTNELFTQHPDDISDEIIKLLIEKSKEKQSND